MRRSILGSKCKAMRLSAPLVDCKFGLLTEVGVAFLADEPTPKLQE